MAKGVTSVRLSEDAKSKAAKLAHKQNRTFTNLVETLILDQYDKEFVFNIKSK